MLYTYTNTAQTLAANAVVLFNTTEIQTGCTATHEAGSGAVNLNRPGFYMVHVNADMLGTVAGLAQLSLYVNGVAYPGALASSTVAVAGTENVGFTAIVRVANNNCPCNTANSRTTLTLRNTGVDVTLTNVAMTVTKLA